MKFARFSFNVTAFAVLTLGAVALASPSTKELWNKAMSGQILTPAEKSQIEPLYRELEANSRNPLDAVGGPDAYGYYFVDNQGGDTTTYSWIELRGDPQANWLTFGNPDDGCVSVTPSFVFPFYGGNYSEMWVCANGFIAFEEDQAAHINQCLPTSSVSGPAIFPFWDDLHLYYGGNGQQNNNTVAWRDFGNYLVIEFDSIGHYGFPTPPTDSYKFQVILYANGSVKMQYNNMNYASYATSHTIGMQQGSSGAALEYVCNSTGPANGYAVWFYRAGYGQFNGTVTFQGQPVYQATVWIQGADIYAWADGTGQFYFPAAPVGQHTVTASCYGYTTMAASVIVTDNQLTTANFSLDAYPTYDFAWNHDPVAIADLDTLYSELNVDQGYLISGIAVRIENLQHTYMGDLGLWLESPLGERVSLSQRNGGDGDNMIACQFDQSAGQSIQQGYAPFSARFWPEEPFTFANDNCRGTWKLIIYDHADFDTGSLVDWSLSFTGTSAAEGYVHGHVESAYDHSPLSGAQVYCPSLMQTYWCDENGDYGVWLPVGTHSLEFSAPGYCDWSTANFTVAVHGDYEHDASLDQPRGTPSQNSIEQTGVVGGTYTQSFTLNAANSCDWSYDITISEGSWLSVSPASGIVAPDGSQQITLTFDASDLPVGFYSCELHITHNGASGMILIPVTLDLASAADPSQNLPTEFALRGNYPNPFNAQTTISFDLPVASSVNVAVHNLLGQEIAVLQRGVLQAGYHTLNWTAKANNGASLPTGLYFLRMTAGDRTMVG
ncbi:carboxypeptidase-like regulatory domain-containing protein, partial [bacterium]|nr:carboxypeptidase-like regulatory domain-containing protein [bacterium]